MFQHTLYQGRIPVLTFPTEIIRTVMTFPTEIIRTVLPLLTEMIRTVLTLLTEIIRTVPSTSSERPGTSLKKRHIEI